MKTLKIAFLITLLSIFAFPTMAVTKHKMVTTKHGKVVKVVYVHPVKVVKVVYVRVPHRVVRRYYDMAPTYYSHNSGFRHSHTAYKSTAYFNRCYPGSGCVPMKKLMIRYANPV